jgi:hypothetical protein
MTTKSAAVAAELADKRPKFLPIGSFLYCRFPILMLRGFAIDMPPGSCYIWKYYIPLFDDIEFLNMSLGYRIPGSYFNTKHINKKRLVERVIDVIDENDDFIENESLEEIAYFAKNKMVSSIERIKLYRKMKIFENDRLDAILTQAAVNRRKLGIEE